MPNHITNRITIEDRAGASLADIRAKFINDKGQVDFELLMPMPACLKDFEPNSGIVDRAKAALGLFRPIEETNGQDIRSMADRLALSNAVTSITTPARDEDVPAIIRGIQNYHECGHIYWYDWHNANWGTKWNAYGQPEGGHSPDAECFEFETAWSHPGELVRLLSEQLPNVTFYVEYADEDIGANCGRYRAKGGEMFDANLAPRYDEMSDEQKKQFAEMAWRICHGDEDPASYGFDENWVYSDAVYEAYEAAQQQTQ